MGMREKGGREGLLPPFYCMVGRGMVVLCIWGMVSEGWGEESLVRRDFERLLGRDNISLGIFSLGVAGIARHCDDELKGEVGDHGAVGAVLDLANVYGSSTYSLASAFGVWGVARAGGQKNLQAVASEVLRGLILANALVSPLKLAVGRQRPDGSNDFSFPSGHSANAFAITAVLGRRYGWRVGVPLYVFTATVPVARIHHRRHFFSDVVAGSALGTLAGFAVTRQEEKGRLAWMPVYTRAGWGVRAQWSY